MCGIMYVFCDGVEMVRSWLKDGLGMCLGWFGNGFKMGSFKRVKGRFSHETRMA